MTKIVNLDIKDIESIQDIERRNHIKGRYESYAAASNAVREKYPEVGVSSKGFVITFEDVEYKISCDV